MSPRVRDRSVARLPLTRDEKLWDAFAEDREASKNGLVLEPRSSTRRGARPDNCQTCGYPLRPTNTFIGDYPGTRRHAGRGNCHSCYKKEATK